uniref:FYVE-type domain-containing protein n=1 Tax=Steinernema glaseri TaxID=37863 RepID=A0A1I8AFI4_9BILA
MITAVDWAKPFIRQLDEDRFAGYVDIFAENDWELNEFARQMLEEISETKQRCTNLRLRMGRTADQSVIERLAVELREQRDLYAMHVTRYTQYFGSLDSCSSPSPSVVYRERRFFREIRTSVPPLPLERPPPCPSTGQEGRVEDRKTEVRPEICPTTLCELAVEQAADSVITNLIGEAESTSSSQRRQRVVESAVNYSVFDGSLNVEGRAAELEMEAQLDEEISRHMMVEPPREVTRVEERLLGHGASSSSEVAQSSDRKEDVTRQESFEIVSQDEIDEAIEQCVEEILTRTEELSTVPLEQVVSRDQFDVPADPIQNEQEAVVCEANTQVYQEESVAEEVVLPEDKHTAVLEEKNTEGEQQEGERVEEALQTESGSVPHDEVEPTTDGHNVESLLNFAEQHVSHDEGDEHLEEAEEVAQFNYSATHNTDEVMVTSPSEDNSSSYVLESMEEHSSSIDAEASVTENTAQLSETDFGATDYNANYEECTTTELTGSHHFVAQSEERTEEVVQEPFSITDTHTEDYGAYERHVFQEDAMKTLEKTEELRDVPLPVPKPERTEPLVEETIYKAIYSNPPPRSSVSRPLSSTAHFSFQTCSTTYIPCPSDEESQLVSESSDVGTDPSYTVDPDEEFEEIGDDEFERAEREAVYDNAYVPEEGIYDIPPTPSTQRSADAMRAEVPNPPVPRPVSPMLNLGRQRQMELGVTLQEEDEIAYEEQEQERRKRFEESIYSPPPIPEIAIDLVDTPVEDAELYEDDEHIYEEIDDYGTYKKEVEEDAVYSEPPVPENVPSECPVIEKHENHYEEPQASRHSLVEEHGYSVPDALPENMENGYSEVPYDTARWRAEPKAEVNQALSRSTSSLPHTPQYEVYYRNVYEDLDVPHPAEPNADNKTSARGAFPYYVEPDYTTNAIRRMSRYNSWSQEAIEEGMRSKSMDFVNHVHEQHGRSSSENVYHAAPTFVATLPRNFPSTSDKTVEQQRTVYVPKPASRVTSSVREWSSSSPRNDIQPVQPQPRETKKAEAPLPPPLDLTASARSVLLHFHNILFTYGHCSERPLLSSFEGRGPCKIAAPKQE